MSVSVVIELLTDMKINGVIERKFQILDEYLLGLRKAAEGWTLDSFKADWAAQRLTERALQVMVEITIDVAERIIALKGSGPCSTAAEAIDKLVQLEVLSSAQPYRDMVKFRNFVVHQYEHIDPELLFTLATTKLGDFQKFRSEIDRLKF